MIAFLTRIALALSCFFRVLADRKFALRVGELRSRALPPASPSPAASDQPVDQDEKVSEAGALVLLGMLQREARLVDFVQQDIGSYSDVDVGAAARVVHEGCRRALRGHAVFSPIREEAEGASVRLESGFDSASVKLVGNVRGAAPYQGVLRHRGWRVESLTLPRIVGTRDLRVIAPAELELR